MSHTYPFVSLYMYMRSPLFRRSSKVISQRVLTYLGKPKKCLEKTELSRFLSIGFCAENLDSIPCTGKLSELFPLIDIRKFTCFLSNHFFFMHVLCLCIYTCIEKNVGLVINKHFNDIELN